MLHPAQKATAATVQTSRFLYTSIGQFPRPLFGTLLPPGSSLKKTNATSPIRPEMAARAHQLCLHPSTGSRSTNSGVNAPMTIKLTPPPAAARPAATPLRSVENQDASIPMTGVVAAEEAKPRTPLATTATAKFSANPMPTMASAPMNAPPATINRAPYLEARAPKTNAPAINRIEYEVNRMPSWAYERLKLSVRSGPVTA